MTQPQIQYARTSDGVSIAYATIGAGPPILYCPDHVMAFEHHWTDSAPTNSTIRRLSSSAQLTIFDAAGTGASQRDASDFSLETQVRVIEAVATHLPASQFTLIGSGTATASAALYAAQHPARVRGLVCLFPALPIVRRTGAAIRDNWSLDRRRMAGATFPNGPVSSQRWYSNAMRESMTPEVLAAYQATFADADLGVIYQGIPVPTLLCIPQERPAREASLALASVVPNCRVATTPYVGDEVLAAILEFMGIQAAEEPRGGMAANLLEASDPSPGLAASATILFVDVVDSTATAGRIGNQEFRDRTRQLEKALRQVIQDAGGASVEGRTLGDGVLGVFKSAAQAIDAALHCEEHAERVGLQLHLGIHAGDVIHETGNVSGMAVSIAARISDLTAPNEILVSSTVRDLARASTTVVFEDRGEREMKGVGEAVRVYAVIGAD